MSLLTNLISAWELAEASGNALDSHSTNELTETSGTIDSTGGFRDFEAADTEAFRRADNAALSTGDIDFTFSCEVNAETLVDFATIIAKWDTNSEYLLWFMSNRFRFGVGTGAAQVFAVANTFGAPSTATLYRIRCWHGSVNNLVGIAVNGVEDTVSHSGGVMDSAHAFEIGGNVNNAIYWDGLIRRVRFWKRLLTANEAAALDAGLAYANFLPTAGAIAVSNLEATSVTLTADAPTGGVSPYTYQWYRDTTPGFTPGGGNIVSGATSLTLNDSGLDPETTYYYVLRVTDDSSGTDDSDEEEVTTLARSGASHSYGGGYSYGSGYGVSAHSLN